MTRGYVTEPLPRIKRDCTHRAQHKHGTLLAYQGDRCRCLPCRSARADAAEHYRTGAPGKVQSGTVVSVAGSARRLQALAAIGHTYVALSERLGVSRHQVRLYAIGRHPLIARATAERIASVYDEFWGVRPDGHGAKVMRTCARKNGWLPPLAWDDDTIDDPAAKPYRNAVRRAS